MKHTLKKAALILVLFLGGCSSITFIYNQFDNLFPWYLQSYVDLDRDQKKYLDELLTPFFQWHRVEEMPKYAQIIGDLELAINDEVDIESITLITYNVEESWFRLEDQMIMWATPLARELSDDQITKFIQVLKTKTTQSEKKLLVRNDQVYQSDSYKSLRKNLRRFMGSLTKDQLDLVKITSKEMKRVDAERIQSRKAFNEKLSLILQREQGWEERLKKITHSDDLVDENYQSTYTFNTDLIQHLLVAILNSRNDKQDQRLRTQLARYKADINSLAN
ncbi:DUF6279 family lipoprotein [Candidatus Pseudothioglobus sp. Uisw_086]|uniref:DUF6279 family lipoprotein n=1 Tax=Candidatus Pseudothioglobus sp. Uisw_086 TaxID=3230998 RepID=UPI003A8C7684